MVLFPSKRIQLGPATSWNHALRVVKGDDLESGGSVGFVAFILISSVDLRVGPLFFRALEADCQSGITHTHASSQGTPNAF